MPTDTQRNVPDDQVATVVAGFEAEGGKVTKVRNPDGTWTVEATFPDGGAGDKSN